MSKVVPFPAGPVTGEDIKRAAIMSGTDHVNHHECSLCGYMTRYVIREGNLYFDSGCNCVPQSSDSLRQVDWSDAEAWINMQTDECSKHDIMARFGFGCPVIKDLEAQNFTSNNWYDNNGNPAEAVLLGLDLSFLGRTVR